jgi:DNA-binding transcriptional regulator YiaG
MQIRILPVAQSKHGESMTPEQIRELRGKLTQAQFARKLGLSLQQISNLETGRCKTGKKAAKRLERYAMRKKLLFL